MTRIIPNESKRRLPATLAAGLAISTCLALGTLAAPASAAGPDRGGDNRDGGQYNDGRGHDGWGWNRGYYAAPPVVYAPYYYAPPPVVYGPGVYLPGFNINIR